MTPGLRQVRPASLLALGMLLGAASATGCAQNAIFELTLDLPMRPASVPMGTEMYAFPQLRSGTSEAFTDRWAGQDPLTGVALSATERTTMKISVIGNSDIEARPVRLKTQFCVDPRCNGFGDDSMAPIDCVELERVFYVGSFTSLPYNIMAVPTIVTCATADVRHIGRCEIRGCVDGDTTSYCRLEDGTHFCE